MSALLWKVGWCFVAVRLGSGCSCNRQSVEAAYSQADVVFEAKIVAVSGPITSGAWPAGHVTFKVSRVWKGNVPSSFEMPAVVEGGSCLGFYPSLLKPDNELLVYASRLAWTPSGEKGFLTDACARTQLLQTATEDLANLPAISEKTKTRRNTQQTKGAPKK